MRIEFLKYQEPAGDIFSLQLTSRLIKIIDKEKCAISNKDPHALFIKLNTASATRNLPYLFSA